MSTHFEREAQGKLRIAVLRMVKKYPFHAHLLQPDRFQSDSEVGTIGVTIRDCKLRFLYSPEFVSDCEFAELIGILHHAVNHILFEHPFVQPECFPDREARTIAEEVTVNEWISEPLPGTPITLDQFPHLPKREDTETRYNRLVQKTGFLTPKRPANGPEKPSNVLKMTRKGPKNDSSGDVSQRKTTDNHDFWRESRENPTLGKLLVRRAVRQAKHSLEHHDWENLPENIRHQIETILAGSQSKNISETIQSSSTGSVNWKRALRRFVARATESQPSLHRVSRRFPDLVGIVPGRSHSTDRLNVMAVIDTSASMTTDLLEQIGSELRILSRDCNIVLVECDTEIRSVSRFKRALSEVTGRGGTDLRPPFERHFLARYRADVLIYFTDGQGPAPEKPARIPTLWCLTPEGIAPTEWGKVVTIGSP